MELIIVCVVFYLVCSWLGSGNNSSGSSSRGSSGRNASSFARNIHRKNSADDSFEEADSFYDRDGNEHIVDDDRYCEDCDDYHDDT